MRIFLFFLLTVSIIGCSYGEKPKKPENLISKDKMVDILYDVFVINSAKGTNKSVLEDHGIYPEDYIFKKHQIDSLQFALSNEYYGFHVETYEYIMIELEERLNRDKDKFQAKLDKEAADKLRKKDSIKKLSDTLKINKNELLKKIKIPDSKD